MSRVISLLLACALVGSLHGGDEKHKKDASVLTLPGHDGWVAAVAFSPDGALIATGCSDDTLKIWDAKSGKERLTRKAGGKGIAAIAFSPDSKRIVSAHWNKTLKLWDAQTGNELLTLRGHKENVTSCAFSHDGKRIVSGSADDTMKIWDADSGKHLLTIDPDNEYDINAAQFSPDGKRIASGDGENNVKIWDSRTGKELTLLEGHEGTITSIAYNHDGKRVASGSMDNTVRIWDPAAEKTVHTLRGHTDSVTAVAFSRDGKIIVSASEDATVKIWDAKTGEIITTLRGHRTNVMSVAISPDGKRVAAGSKASVKIWVIAGDNSPRGIYRASPVPESPLLLASGMAWSEKGLVIADRKEKRLVVLKPDGKFDTLRKMTSPFGVAFDPDGKVLVSEKIDVNHIVRINGDKLDVVVDSVNAGTPHALAVHKNGTIYWSGFPDGGTRSHTPNGQVTIHKPRIGHTNGIALSPKQDWLYVTSKLPDKNSRAVWRFPVALDGTLGEGKPFFFVKDLKPNFDGLPAPKDGDETLLGWIGRVQGLAIDRAGNFYIAGAESHTSGSAIAVIGPDGKKVCAMILDVPRNIASLALSGDERTLYCAGAGEYRLYQVSFDPPREQTPIQRDAKQSRSKKQ